ncbi:NADPH-dependent FMN reductase [Pseudonocardia sp. HH130630-07]|uniref:NADPH-dependent FMN reductase n=1 Tax=Pseudonocardia sp. HH130630-07 TaxID=1690815 RepID=UPI00081522DF|nr:NAD(P)H-dependent oxidoreductase [Pseudonocardia sp. HH130630-07]ANY09179.1 NADPH-dependent FMN reductase [Pseudonocardia sp. HH130630-07]
MNNAPVRIAVLIGSVRAGRFGPTVARWFAGETGRRDDVEIDLVDLHEANLSPALDGNRDDPHDPVEPLRRRLAAADAFVVVTPEYNHSYPAGLKTAIDSFHAEWAAKPVGFVSYGGLSGGIRAVEHLRPVFVELHAAPVRDAVSLHEFWNLFDDDGGLTDGGAGATAAHVLTDQLVWWGRTLRDGRASHGLVA